MSTEIVHKTEGHVTTMDTGDIVLEHAAIVKLRVGPELVDRFERVGNDLQLVLKDGRTITIRNFFVIDEDGKRSDLVLEDADEVLWWGQYTSPWSEFHFTEIEMDHTAAALLPAAGGFPAWAGIALGVIGGAGIINRFGDSDDDRAPAPVEPPPQPNRAPTAPGYSHTLDEDTAVNGRVQGSDPDGDPLAVTVGSVPGTSRGTVYLAGGTTAVAAGQTLTLDQLVGLVFRPAADASGDAGQFRYTVSDGKGGTAVASIDLEITAVPDAPVAVADFYGVTRNGTLEVPVASGVREVPGAGLGLDGPDGEIRLGSRRLDRKSVV